MRDVSLRLILKDKGSIYTTYHFIDSSNLRVEIPSKRRGQQKNGALEQRTEAPLHACTGVSRKFTAKPVCFRY